MGSISSLNKQNKNSYLSIAPIFQELCVGDNLGECLQWHVYVRRQSWVPMLSSHLETGYLVHAKLSNL